MNKIMKFTLFLALVLTSCGQEEDKTPEKTFLKIDPILDSPLTTDKFGEGTTIGLFVTEPGGGNYNNCECSANVPAVLHGTDWTLSREIEIINPGDIFAYCPYSNTVSDGKRIPIETASQTDYLYSDKAAITNTDPVAKLKMKHALSLIRFKVEKTANGLDLGGLTALRFEDVGISAAMEYGTGILKDIVKGNETYDQTGDIPRTISLIAMPHKENVVVAVFIIGGKEYKYEAKGNWESGKEITYTLSFDPETRTLLSAGVTTIQDWVIGGNYNGDLTKPYQSNERI